MMNDALEWLDSKKEREAASGQSENPELYI